MTMMNIAISIKGCYSVLVACIYYNVTEGTFVIMENLFQMFFDVFKIQYWYWYWYWGVKYWYWYWYW